MSVLGKVLAGITGAVIVVVGGFLALLFWSFHELEAGPPPDVEKAAHSATAQAADQTVSAQVDAQVGRLRTALPWATYLGTAIEDICRTKERPTGSFGGKESWLPVTCTRTDTVYEAFDGDFRQRAGQLDGALSAAGWQPWDGGNTASQKGSRPGLVAQLDHLHDPPWHATPSDLAAAAARPNILRLDYSTPITSNVGSTGYGRDQNGGMVEVTQAPHLPTLDGGQFDHDEMVKYPSVTTSYFRTWQPYSKSQVAAAYPGHGAVIAFALSASYGTGG